MNQRSSGALYERLLPYHAGGVFGGSLALVAYLWLVKQSVLLIACAAVFTTQSGEWD